MQLSAPEEARKRPHNPPIMWGHVYKYQLQAHYENTQYEINHHAESESSIREPFQWSTQQGVP